MAKIYKNAAELVGNTPLLEVGNLEKELGLESRILVKLEYFNPAGSAKDRIALSMIEDAEERGVLKPGAVIIELHQVTPESVLLLLLQSKDTE